MPDKKLSNPEQQILNEIKNLTRSRSYGNVCIVIRAGIITAVQTTKDIRLSDKKGDNPTDSET